MNRSLFHLKRTSTTLIFGALKGRRTGKFSHLWTHRLNTFIYLSISYSTVYLFETHDTSFNQHHPTHYDYDNHYVKKNLFKAGKALLLRTEVKRCMQYLLTMGVYNIHPKCCQCSSAHCNFWVNKKYIWFVPEQVAHTSEPAQQIFACR